MTARIPRAFWLFKSHGGTWSKRILFLACLTSPLLDASVTLPRVLASHMVLQRDRPIHLWGWADAGEKISISLNGADRSTATNPAGRWSIYLPPQAAGGPFQLRIQGTNQVVLDDVLIGDVWFASGQSNMEMPLSGFPGSAEVKNSAEEISRANLPNVRLLLVPRKASAYPLTDMETGPGWAACTSETAAKFSAVAYFFGRAIAMDQHVPIGLIDSTWGGTPAEAWTSLEGIGADASLMPVFAARAHMIAEEAELLETVAAEKRADALAKSRNQSARTHKWRPDLSSWDPSWLFNGMVAPFVGYPIKGVIWYQGESNSSPDRASLYARLFPAMITDWRGHWQQGDFPFLYVQISSFEAGQSENWPLVREAQRRTLSLVNTGMAVTVDVGDAHNVHPADKQTVGARLALAARTLAYGEMIEYSGPAFRQATPEAGTLRIWFDHAEGLKFKSGSASGFEIAGGDGHFVTANARIDGSTVVASSRDVPVPRWVRYCWSNVPAASLYNSADLPASPFSSADDLLDSDLE
jgi:sialate O-acetylesterase